ncbi:MAG: PQQ-binding-like beta-propeller repeat protein [Myxococcota bacterium]
MSRLTAAYLLTSLWLLFSACGSSEDDAKQSVTQTGGMGGQISGQAGEGGAGDHPEGGAGGKPRTDPRTVYLNETSTNWAMARGYPRGTSYNPHERELNPNTVAELVVRWRSPSESWPLVQHDHRIFASYVEAFEASDGTPLWTNSRSTRSAVYCAGVLLQTYRGIQGVEPTTGAHRVDIPAAAGDAELLFGPATAKGSDAVFPVLFQNWSAFPGEYLTEFRIFNAETRLTRLLRSDFVSLAPVAITGGRIYTPTLVPRSAGANVHWDYAVQAVALDPDSGLTGWSFVLDADTLAAAPQIGVAVIAGRVFAANADGGALVALDQKTGEIVWRSPTRVAIHSLAATFDQIVIAGSRDAQTTIVEAYEPAQGKLLYSSPVRGALSGQIAIAGQIVYVGTDSGELHMLHADSGELLGSIELGGVVTDPIVTRGRIFVATGQAVYSLGLPDAELAPEEVPDVGAE